MFIDIPFHQHVGKTKRTAKGKPINEKTLRKTRGGVDFLNNSEHSESTTYATAKKGTYVVSHKLRPSGFLLF